MKKTIKDKDGNETVFEGTPEELADLEKRLREDGGQSKPKSGKKLLKEEEVRQLIKEELDKRPAPFVVQSHFSCSCPICCPFKPYFVEPIVYPFRTSPQVVPYIGDPLPVGEGPFWYTITSASTSIDVGGLGDNLTTAELKLRS